MNLGDNVKAALELVGVTEDRVTRWLGRSCGGCRRRQEKLNELGWLCGRIIKGTVRRGRDALLELLAEE